MYWVVEVRHSLNFWITILMMFVFVEVFIVIDIKVLIDVMLVFFVGDMFMIIA
jgi:hypothetical protein